jgi:hypothetical protein
MTAPGAESGGAMPAFKVAMLGPSGVGKTSIVVSVLDDAPRALAHHPVLLRARDEPTQRRLQIRRDQLYGGVAAHAFRSDALKGDENATHYQLELRVQDSDVRIDIDLLDYPGGWTIPAENGADAHRRHWEEVQQFIANADMVLIPVDAVLLMEARTASQRTAVIDIHSIAAVEDVVEQWAAARQGTDRTPLLVIAPIKTESYLADNGGVRDQHRELQAAVTHVYDGVLRRFLGRAPAGEALYCPVDTLGCVELTRLDWHPRGDGKFEPQGRFLVRPGQSKIAIRGAADILVAICRNITSYAEATAERQAGRLAGEHQRAVMEHERMTEDVFSWIFYTITGKIRAIKSDEERYAAGSAQYRTYAKQLSSAVADLATMSYQRARPVSGEGTR